MSFANSSISDVIATTIQNRSRSIADNVTKNNAILTWIKENGGVKTVSGGNTILQELSFAENSNTQWYSGNDTLGTSAQDVISAAEYSWKQLSTAVVITGLEKAQNSGKERMIDLIASRVDVAEASMANKLAQGCYADGTGSGGKELAGLGSLVVASPSTGTVGGIDRANFSFWRNYAQDTNASPSASTIAGVFNTEWLNLTRGSDKPDLIVADNTIYAAYEASLQNLQRFTAASKAQYGFDTLQYKSAAVVADGGIGGFQATAVAHFLNTKYLFLRPHKDFNMVPINADRGPWNQDADVKLMVWYGAMTASNCSLQGYLVCS